MSTLPLTFVRPWNIHTPQVVREIDTEFVDAFFRDGSLRISSFVKFQQHPDEQRRDEKEGRMAVDIKTADGYLSSRGSFGNAYVMSASLHQQAPRPGKSRFRIKNTLEFANAIARQIQGFIGGHEGPCMYADGRVIVLDTQAGPPPPDLAAIHGMSESEQEQAMHAHRVELGRYVDNFRAPGFFMKEPQFAHESEYRFVWEIDSPAKEYVDLKVPAAATFCERIPD